MSERKAREQRKRAADAEAAAGRRGLVEVFIVDGKPAKVGFELYPPGGRIVTLEMFPAEAREFANGILEGCAEAEKVNQANA